jgi:lipopolysaccharide transport system permease protein
MSAPGHASPSADLARKRDLWWQFTVRAVETRHRGSYLGVLWALLNPLLMLALYFCMFGVIFQSRFGVLPNETHLDYALALFLGLVLAHLVTETLTVAPVLIVSQPNLVKKVVFPLEVLPLAQIGAAWFHLLISFVLLLAASLIFGRGLDGGILMLPVILMPLVLLSAGLAWLFAALGVFFRDLTQVMPFIAQILLFASAIFYPVTKITPGLWAVLKWNPLLHTVQLARDAVLWGAPLNFKHLAYTYVVAVIVFFVGRWVFIKLKPAFADVL